MNYDWSKHDWEAQALGWAFRLKFRGITWEQAFFTFPKFHDLYWPAGQLSPKVSNVAE
jgi:hypothetical protein